MVRRSLRPLDGLLVVCIFFVLYLASSSASLWTFWPFRLLTRAPALRCTPREYASGHWVRKPGAVPVLSRHQDVFSLHGWTGCASGREPEWHLATAEPAMFGWRAQVSHYTYQPASSCSTTLRRFSGAQLVRHLVEHGGWLLQGDSVTEGHFFSLSCALYPHVRATPTYVRGAYLDRSWPQNLYLLPNSSLVPTLRLPPGFSFEHTPLVTFRRIDVILAPEELLPLYARHAPNRTTSANPALDELYGNLQEAVYNAQSAEMLSLFTSPPPLNYGTLIMSSGAHWTESVFGKLSAPDEIISFFSAVIAHWLERVAEALAPTTAPTWGTAVAWRGATSGGTPRRVIVRGATWGSEDCLLSAVRLGGPRAHVVPLSRPYYNWAWIPRLNEVAERAVTAIGNPFIHYLSIERPAMLRPDSHVLPDCLHLTAGTGAMETWTEYIAHFLWAEQH